MYSKDSFKKYSDVAIRILCKKIPETKYGAKHLFFLVTFTWGLFGGRVSCEREINKTWTLQK